MRDVVLYVGGFRLPDHSASALRALGNASVLREAGYEVLIAGKFAGIPDPSLQPVDIHGFRCHDIRQPLPDIRRVDYTISPRPISRLLEHVGRDRVAAIMAYNYPGYGLHRLLNVARELCIPVINESTEWYGWEGFRPITNTRRIIESRWRNTSLVEQAGNLICASRWMQERHPQVNSLVLPFALDPTWERWAVEPDTSWCDATDVVKLVYSGSPGLGMHKDRLPLIIEAMDRAAGCGLDFRFAIVGMTAQDYVATVPDHAGILSRHGHRIAFLGRVPHAKAVAVLKSADISVFIREVNRVSDVGFPTKYAEAATCGVPVLTNRTSDIADYLVDGHNGVLLRDASKESLDLGVERVLSMPRGAIDQMKAQAAADNPFAVGTWVTRMQAFMDGLRLPK